MNNNIIKMKKILSKVQLFFSKKIEKFAIYSEVFFSKKFILLTIVTFLYIAYAYVYEYNAIQRESEYLVNSFSKQIDFSVSKVSDYVKINVAYYNNVFKSETYKKNYLVNNFHWNTQNFFTLDNFNQYNVYEFGNLTGFGNKDSIIGLRDEMSVVLNANDIYIDLYNNHPEYVQRILYFSNNKFLYSYPYQLSKYYSYVDRLAVERNFDNSININQLNWSGVFLDEQTNQFAMSLYKEIYNIENGVETKSGTLAVDIILPKYQVLPQYEYYVVDDNLNILATNNETVKPTEGVKTIYEIKETSKKSNLTENIFQEKQLFSFGGEIFSVKKMESAPLYFIISKQKFNVLNHIYYVILASITAIVFGFIIFNDYNYHIREQVKRKSKMKTLSIINAKLKEDYQRDYLTGVYKKESVIEKCKQLWLSKSSYTVTIVDVDRLDNIQEVYGRIIADEILKRVASNIQELLGNDTYLGKLTNSSFIYVLEEADYKRVAHIAQVIRNAIKNEYYTIDQELCARLTVSCGVSEQRYDIDSDHTTCINNANSAVLESKQKGGNRVIFYTSKK